MEFMVYIFENAWVPNLNDSSLIYLSLRSTESYSEWKDDISSNNSSDWFTFFNIELKSSFALSMLSESSSSSQSSSVLHNLYISFKV